MVVISTLLVWSWWLRRGLCAEALLACPCSCRNNGTCVVQAQSPLTIVASRWTWVPRISANASVRPRTAPGTPRRRATPGSGAGRSARRGSARPPAWWWWRSRRRSARRPRGRRPPRRRLGHRCGSTPRGCVSMRRRANVRIASSPPISRSCRIAADGQVVVGVLELGPARGGQPVPLGGPAPALVLPGRRGVGLRVARVDQRVEVPAHAGGGDAQPLADLAGGDGSRLQQQLDDRAAGMTVRVGSCGGSGTRAPPPDGFSQHHCDAIPEPGLARAPLARRSDRTSTPDRDGYAAVMAARLQSLSSSIARWHGDERTVGSPLNDAELVALRRTRLFGATGTVLMAIGALGAGARPWSRTRRSGCGCSTCRRASRRCR